MFPDHETISKYVYQEPSAELEDFMQGMDEECDLKVPEKPPDWLDKDKYMLGRQVYFDYRAGVMISNFRNLIIGLSMPNLWYD